MTTPTIFYCFAAIVGEWGTCMQKKPKHNEIK